MILEKVYDELMAQIEDLKKAIAGGSGGSKDYDKLDNRPKINNITLSGNKKSSDLKIAYSMTEAEYAAATKNAESIYCLQENATTFEEEDETASTYIHWSESGTGHVASWVYAPSNQNFTGCTAVECDDAAITIDQFQVVEGNVQVFLSCEDTTQIGETVTFTFTLTQPAGSTRIVKNGLEYCRSFSIQNLYHNEGSAESSIHLSESYDLFDALQITIAYTGSAGHALTNRWILVNTIDRSTDFSVTSEAWYSKFAFTNSTTLTITGGQESKILDVTGVKF